MVGKETYCVLVRDIIASFMPQLKICSNLLQKSMKIGSFHSKGDF